MYPMKRVLITVAAVVALTDCAGRANAARERAWSEQLNQRLRELVSSSQEVKALNAVEPDDDLDAYKQTMRQTISALDRFDKNLLRVESVLNDGLQGAFLDASGQQRCKLELRMWADQGRLSKKRREYANAVLSLEPNGQPQPEFVARMESLQAEMQAIQRDLLRSMKAAGVAME